MAIRVGACTLVQRLEAAGPGGIGSEGVWVAHDEVRLEWVLADVRQEDSLQLPDESLDDALAQRQGEGGLLVPKRRTRTRGDEMVALVEPLRPRQSLLARGGVPAAAAAWLFADLLDRAAYVLSSDISLGLLTAQDLVLVQEGPDKGREPAAARLLVSTGAARRVESATVPRRNLVAVLTVLPLVTPAESDGGWQRFCSALLAEVTSGALDAGAAADRLRSFAPGPLPRLVLPPLPSVPGTVPRPAARRLPVAPASERRRVGVLEVGAGLLGIGCVAALLAVLQNGALSGAEGSPAGGSTDRRLGGSTSAPRTSSPASQPPPVDTPAAGAPCAFYDVGVLDRSGPAVLRCVLRSDGGYQWQVTT